MEVVTLQAMAERSSRSLDAVWMTTDEYRQWLSCLIVHPSFSRFHAYAFGRPICILDVFDGKAVMYAALQDRLEAERYRLSGEFYRTGVLAPGYWTLP